MSWLPLLLPRPELFGETGFPDIARHERDDILSFHTGSRAASSQVTFWRKEDDRLAPYTPQRNCEMERRIEIDLESDTCGTTMVSLPIFTWVYLFAEGYADDKLHAARDVFASNIEVFIAPSFITWIVAGKSQPIYRRDRMKWTSHVPVPDMGNAPSDTAVQIIIPFHRNWGSNHKRMMLAARLEDDLLRLSEILNWQPPQQPVRLDLPPPR